VQDTTRAGELLVDALLRLIRDEPFESTMLPASLVVRSSSGQPAADPLRDRAED
jgi:DNA-binding LacI/PurR family transcriptional regulator